MIYYVNYFLEFKGLTYFNLGMTEKGNNRDRYGMARLDNLSGFYIHARRYDENFKPSAFKHEQNFSVPATARR